MEVNRFDVFSCFGSIALCSVHGDCKNYMDSARCRCIFYMHRKRQISILHGAAMRTTLDLPEVLMQEAMAASHQKTKTAVIITALQDLVRKSRLHELRSFKGRVDVDLDLNVVRKRS